MTKNFNPYKRVLEGVKTPYHELIREGENISGMYSGQDRGVNKLWNLVSFRWNLFGIFGIFPESLESFQNLWNLWNLSRIFGIFGIFVESLESQQNFWNLIRIFGISPESPESHQNLRNLVRIFGILLESLISRARPGVSRLAPWTRSGQF